MVPGLTISEVKEIARKGREGMLRRDYESIRAEHPHLIAWEDMSPEQRKFHEESFMEMQREFQLIGDLISQGRFCSGGLA